MTSIRVDPGCEAIVYEDIEYRGRSAVIRADAAAIDDFGIGNDTASSIRVVCGQNRNERGVTLFDGVDFSGNYEFFGGRRSRSGRQHHRQRPRALGPGRSWLRRR